MSNSFATPGKFLCPWNFPGKNTGVGCHFLPQGIFLTQGSNPYLQHCRWILHHWATREAQVNYVYMSQSCLILWDPMYCSPPGSVLHGIFQTIILEWVAISYPRGSSGTCNQACTSHIGREILYHLHHLGNPYYSTIIRKRIKKNRRL